MLKRMVIADQTAAVVVLAEEMHRVAKLFAPRLPEWNDLSPVKRQEWMRWARKVATRLDGVIR